MSRSFLFVALVRSRGRARGVDTDRDVSRGVETPTRLARCLGLSPIRHPRIRTSLCRDPSVATDLYCCADRLLTPLVCLRSPVRRLTQSFILVRFQATARSTSKSSRASCITSSRRCSRIKARESIRSLSLFLYISLYSSPSLSLALALALSLSLSLSHALSQRRRDSCSIDLDRYMVLERSVRVPSNPYAPVRGHPRPFLLHS